MIIWPVILWIRHDSQTLSIYPFSYSVGLSHISNLTCLWEKYKVRFLFVLLRICVWKLPTSNAAMDFCKFASITIFYFIKKKNNKKTNCLQFWFSFWVKCFRLFVFLSYNNILATFWSSDDKLEFRIFGHPTSDWLLLFCIKNVLCEYLNQKNWSYMHNAFTFI